MQNLRNSIGNWADGKTSQAPYLQVAETVTLTPNQNIVRVVGNGAVADVNLPPVGDCAGRVFAITAEDGDSFAVTVKDAGDSRDWANIVIAGDGGGVVLYCDGQKFWAIASVVGATT